MNNEDLYRGQFINELLHNYRFNSYLELGISPKAYTYNQVNCKTKVGVDYNPSIKEIYPDIICSTTDAFFENNTQKFDIIFIDACHEKNQTYKDFRNSFEYSNENGIILFHDIYPRTKQGTELSAHGNVFELWMNMYDEYNLSTYIDINNDDAIGIFKKKLNPNWKDLEFKKYTFEEFWTNRNKYIYDICDNRDYIGKDSCLKKY
jgi:hypothetical protein